MTTINTRKASELSELKRFDAEFFLPEYVKSACALEGLSKLARLWKISWVSQGPNPQFTKHGIPCLNGKNINFGTVSAGEPNYVSEETFHHLLNYSLLEKDIVITLKHATKIGRAWIIKDISLPLMFTRNVGIIRLNNDSPINHASLLFFLWSKHAQQVIDRIATGGTSGQITLAVSALKRLPVPIFSNALQIRLDEILKKYYLFLNEVKQKYYSSQHILLSETGLSNWTRNLQKTYIKNLSKVMADNRIDSEHFQPFYEELRDKIRNYKFGYSRLTNICIISDKMIDPYQYPEQNFDYVELSDINERVGTIDKITRIKGREAPNRARMIINKGDILMSSIEGSLNRVAVVPFQHDHSLGSTGFIILHSKKNENGFLLAVSKSLIIQEQMRSESQGTILTSIPKRLLKNIIVPNIPIYIRKEIDKLVGESHIAWYRSKEILKKTKMALDHALDQDEDHALSILNEI